MPHPHTLHRPQAARLVLTLAVVAAAVSACDRSAPPPLTAPTPTRIVQPCAFTDPDCYDPPPPPPPPPFDNSAFGVNTHVNKEHNPLFIDLAADAHVGWVRLGADWDWLQPYGPGSLDPAALADLRSTVRALRARGITPNVILGYSPAWTRYCWRNPENGQQYVGWPDHYTDEPCHTDRYWPPDPSQILAWHSFVGMMLDSLPEVHDWSIWNEPNFDGLPNGDAFLKLPAGQDPIQAYSNLVVWAADQIHRRPGHRVLGPELAHTPSGDSRARPGQQSDRDWLGEFIRASGYLVDVVTVHAYNPAQNVVSMMADYAGQMQYMPAGIPLWLTEAGGGSHDHNDDAVQARDLSAVYRAMTSGQNSRWKKTFWFTLYFPPEFAEQRWYMLTTQAGTVRRPAYNCLSAMAAGTSWYSLPAVCR